MLYSLSTTITADAVTRWILCGLLVVQLGLVYRAMHYMLEAFMDDSEKPHHTRDGVARLAWLVMGMQGLMGIAIWDVGKDAIGGVTLLALSPITAMMTFSAAANVGLSALNQRDIRRRQEQEAALEAERAEKAMPGEAAPLDEKLAWVEREDE